MTDRLERIPDAAAIYTEAYAAQLKRERDEAVLYAELLLDTLKQVSFYIGSGMDFTAQHLIRDVLAKNPSPSGSNGDNLGGDPPITVAGPEPGLGPVPVGGARVENPLVCPACGVKSFTVAMPSVPGEGVRVAKLSPCLNPTPEDSACPCCQRRFFEADAALAVPEGEALGFGWTCKGCGTNNETAARQCSRCTMFPEPPATGHAPK